MLAGVFPFDNKADDKKEDSCSCSDNENKLINSLERRIVNDKPNFRKIEAKCYSLDWITLIKSLLAKNPSNRSKTKVIMKHELWKKNIK